MSKGVDALLSSSAPTGRTRGRPKEVVASRDHVVAAALRVLDRDGVGAFNMRAVAEEAGVARSVVVHHVGNRDALLDAVAERLLSDVVVPPPDLVEHWQDWIRLVATSYRTVLERHPGIVHLLNTMLPTSAAAIDLSTRFRDVLAGAGYTGHELETAHVSVLAFVIGFVSMDAAETVAGTPAAQVNTDAAFRDGFDALLVGLAHRLPLAR
jgi:AcrR family transcriptional regulator